ncbi:sialate O-acetylesterase [Planctomycetales bacterium ZRK34]|nr:sialate O-acetylesterase [Planctomycetales bacterium ZRK34]
MIGAPHANAADTIRVYLVGGQSNADGRASVSKLPTKPINLRQPQADIAFYFHNERGDHPLDRQWTTLRPGASESHQFGPEITFGRTIADQVTDEHTRIAIIKYANGGTNLHTQWAAGGDDSTRGDGREYRIFQRTVHDGLKSLAASHPDERIVLAGMIWMQGEADTHQPASAAAYGENMKRFIKDVRATIDAKLPFVIGRLSVHQTKLQTAGVASVRQGQSDAANSLPRTAWIDTDSFQLKNDHLHFDATGQQQLGKAFADALLRLSSPDNEKVQSP